MSPISKQRGTRVETIDAAIWLFGVAYVLAGTLDALRSGRSFGSLVRGASAASAGIVLTVAAGGLAVLAIGWSAAREEASLLRKYARRLRPS